MELRRHYPVLGDPVTLKCVPPASFPPADVFWALEEPNGQLIPIEYNERVSIDYEGVVV